MKISANIFRKFIANSVIFVLIAGVLAFSITGAAISADAGIEPVYKGASKKKVALMVNIYWGTEFLDDMLSIFKQHDCVTTFFVGGTWVNDNGDCLKKIHAAGHEIGNHGYFHKNHDKIGEARNRQEISSTHNLVKDILGIDMTLFAPPSGAFSKTTLSVAAELSYTTIMWTRDTIDWRDRDSDTIKKRALKNIAGGDLVLMHPTAATVEALNGILDGIKQAGLSVAPVSEVIAG